MRLTTQDDRRRLARLACFAAAAASLAIIAGITLARGKEREYRFNLYAADHGAGTAAMRFKVQAMARGSLGTCYALGAISVDALNQQHPDKDFMGGCVGGEMLTLRQLIDRANALLPKDGEDQ